MILCCGEALIDFMPVNSADGDLAFQPFNGGSIYNVAIALGRLEQDVGYFGGISQDFFGDMLSKELASSNVDLSLGIKSQRATTLAFVNFNGGQPEYVFLDEGSAGRMIENNQMPDIPAKVKLLHFGSISLISEPAASMFEQLAHREAGQRLISIDPNIRPSLVDDEKPYRARLLRMFAIADIIKISDEDLEWLHPGLSHQSFANQMLDENTRLVVITKGRGGAVAYQNERRLEQEIEKANVVDTVGAGDTFMAGLLASLNENRLLTVDNFLKLDEHSLAQALSYASRAAAINVSRKGANPPRKCEM